LPTEGENLAMRSMFAALMLPAMLIVLVWSWTRYRARADQMPAPAAAEVPVAPARKTQAPEREQGFVGVILAGDTLELEPKIEGRILSIAVKAGDQVTRGTEIATLDVGSMRHELTVARLAMARASRQLARRVPLLSRGFSAVTEEELDGARLEAASQRAKVAQLSEALAEARILAPVDGTVAALYLSPGALAGPGRPVARLNGRGDPKVRFAVPEQLPRPPGLGTVVIVKVPPAIETTATVVAVAPEVDVSSRMVYVTAALPPDEPLQAALSTGLLARVALNRED
jgi:RND family efflux transporter MFP subunit